jgi:hypothetical protein
MNAALKQVAVPEPRSRVFAGSLPHFRRPLGNRIDLLSTQFSCAGGSLVVGVASRRARLLPAELGYAPAGGRGRGAVELWSGRSTSVASILRSGMLSPCRAAREATMFSSGSISAQRSSCPACRASWPHSCRCPAVPLAKGCRAPEVGQELGQRRDERVAL